MEISARDLRWLITRIQPGGCKYCPIGEEKCEALYGDDCIEVLREYFMRGEDDGDSSE